MKRRKIRKIKNEVADMGAWGIKALERDEGLDVLDILKNEYVPEHPVMDLGGKDLLLGEIGQKLRMFYRSERSRRA